jgi:hypothetical protein
MCEDQPVWEVLSDAKAEMAVVTHASNSDPAIAQAALRCLIALARYVPLRRVEPCVCVCVCVCVSVSVSVRVFGRW